MIRGRIFDIKRFAVHDGDGIRTTIFFSGCPLRCLWCHNPEGIAPEPRLAFHRQRCSQCGDCLSLCPKSALATGPDGTPLLDRDRCTGCGVCAAACQNEALVRCGRDVTIEDLLPVLLEDRPFYDNSGGGVTLSGGECLLQDEFCEPLLRELKAEGIRTAVDTCGFVTREAIDRVAPWTDDFLYDIKALDDVVHSRCTGRPCGPIPDNLRHLDKIGARIEVRIPFVPGYNDGEIDRIGQFLADLDRRPRVRLLPYNPFAGSKYESLGMKNPLPGLPPPDEDHLAEARRRLASCGLTEDRPDAVERV